MLKKLLANYSAFPESFDEMLDGLRQPRVHWRAMLDCLAHESPDLMRLRHEAVKRQIQENGVTYNVYAEAEGRCRPWDLNVLPQILPHEEWAGIESAVIQRAALMNHILCDLYGEQKLLEESLLPPVLLHGHGGFLRPCHGIKHIDGIALHFYAVDLARAPNGRWWVVADRTQAPSGAGYVLENRSLIARIFPHLMREMKVQHLEGFFSAMRDSLLHWGRLCAANTGDRLCYSEPPLIVLLTPGSYNETYYEHAYLARHLGLPLVEGGDLTVRNGIVWFKTLSGMKRVHVIMRRLDDDFCDPLELRSDSALGVAGLTEAARRGNVLIANSLGSSLLESGALLGFLPALCERLLGEPLKIPSVATWWCGEPAALEEAIHKIEQLVFKPSFPQLRQDPIFGNELTGNSRTEFIKKIRANPQNYVAQELVKLSQAPVWTPGTSSGLRACAMGLRVYACATQKGYVVMPGGLTRVATGPDARILTMQRGGGSKDTWVQVQEQVEVDRILKRTITNEGLVREDTHLSSRVAENLFWFGRYAGRCENIARLLRILLNILFNIRPKNRGAEWPILEALCGWFQLIEVPMPQQGQGQPQGGKQQGGGFSDAQIETTLLLAVISPDVPGLAKQLQQLYYTASQLRERLSADHWRALGQMVPRIASPDVRLSQSEVMSILDDAIASSMKMTGFVMDGMVRDMGWSFLSIGRSLERLQFQSVVLHRALNMDANGDLDWLLELSDNLVAYRARYQAQPEWLPVLDLLLLDESNPRSVMFQFNSILKSLNLLARTYGACGEEQMAPLKEELCALAPETDLYCGNAHLINLLHRIKTVSEALSEQIGMQFFSYTGNYHPRSGML